MVRSEEATNAAAGGTGAASADDETRHSTLRWLAFQEFFEDVAAEELEILLDDIALIPLRRGEALSSEAHAQGDIYILRTGLAVASFSTPEGHASEMAPLEPGDLTGGFAILTGSSFPITVRALRDCTFYRIGETAFRTFLQTSHRGSLGVMRHVGRWLLNSIRPVARPREGRNVALVPVADGLDLVAIGDTIARYIATQRLAVEFLPPASAPDNSEILLAIEAINDVVVMVTSPEDPAWQKRAIANADLVVLVDQAGRTPLPLPDLDEICGDGPKPTLDLLVIHPSEARYPAPSARWAGRTDFDERMNIRDGDASDLEFVARMLTGRAVGLVLAGGGARGYVHMGVIRALREAGMPIDMVAGTSMGAIIGATLAYGWSGDRTMAALRAMYARNSPVGDYTLPLVSLVRGNRVSQRLRDSFEDLTIDEMWRPFFCVSSNLSTGRPHIHRSGKTWEALRASSALPGILPPMMLEGQVLVDGAIMNNFPVDVMRQRGRGAVIGSHIKVDEAFLSTLANIEDLGILGLARQIRAQPVNIFSIMSRTATVSSLKQSEYCCAVSDFLIEAPASDVGLLDWRSLDLLAERAYRHTSEAIEESGLTYDTLIAALGGNLEQFPLRAHG
ncbi:patatin-like phospholipase family protein [Mesorhizobium sp. CAU 1741]|uniref:patatin-like phospholipase family protein n=1 Tax=Mesorhizobium sp. CAU 1741 TaxID=3140366 RepID=UPI00325C09B0